MENNNKLIKIEISGFKSPWNRMKQVIFYKLSKLYNVWNIAVVLTFFICVLLVSFSKNDDINTNNTNNKDNKKKSTKAVRKDLKNDTEVIGFVNANKIDKDIKINDLAPANLSELKEPNVKVYIERYTKTAIGEMDKFGIPASISMAQAIIESRSGTSTLAVKNNNHFGIKCFSKSCAEGHCTNHNDDNHKDFFRKYKGAWESWREHSNFLMKYRYRELKKYGRNYRAWAKGLREFGYATDKSYDKKLIGVIEKYKLHKLDDL